MDAQIRVVSLVTLLALAAAGHASGQQYEMFCLPQSQLKLAGVELGADSQQVRRTLGRPVRMVRDSGADDGGVYPILRLSYKQLQVDIGRDRVERLATTSSVPALPSGIRVGMSIEEVGRLLKLANPSQYLRGDTLAPIACEGGRHDPGLAGVSFIFGKTANARRLVELLLTEYGP
jgi:hypothetical protein